MWKVYCLLTLFSVVILARPQESESFNKLRASHLSKADGPRKKNYNYVEIRSSGDLKKFIKDGCVNVGLDTENSSRGQKINYVSIQNVKLDASSLCKDFEGVNLGIISDDMFDAKLTNYVKIKNSRIGDSVNAGIIIHSKQDILENAQLKNSVNIVNTTMGDARKMRSKSNARMKKSRKQHEKSMTHTDLEGSTDAEIENW